MPDTDAPPQRPRLTPAQRLFQPTTIYYQPEALEYARGRETLARYPDAERIEVPSHQNIPGLFGNEGAARDWVKIKRTVLVLGVRKTFPVRPNGRSADFIAPGHASGCPMSCLYCVAEGTLITTPEGQKPVEQIQDGERICAFDSSSGQLAEAVVCGTASRVSPEVLEIEVGETKLRVTAEHPLMTRRGWVKAGDLTEDDEVLYDDGRTA